MSPRMPPTIREAIVEHFRGPGRDLLDEARADLAQELRWVDEADACELLGFADVGALLGAIEDGSVPPIDVCVSVEAGGGRALAFYRPDVERAAEQLRAGG